MCVFACVRRRGALEYNFGRSGKVRTQSSAIQFDGFVYQNVYIYIQVYIYRMGNLVETPKIWRFLTLVSR